MIPFPLIILLMDEDILVDNLPQDVEPKGPKKKNFSFLLKILIPLFLLLILSILGFVFRDRFFKSNVPGVEEENNTIGNGNGESKNGESESKNGSSPFSSYISKKEYYPILDYNYLKERYSEEEINSLVPENPELSYFPNIVENIGGDLEIKIVHYRPIFLEVVRIDNDFYIKVAMRDENGKPGVFDLFVGQLEDAEELKTLPLVEADGNNSELDIAELQNTFRRGEQIRVGVFTNISKGFKPFESSMLNFCEGIYRLCKLIQLSADADDENFLPVVFLSKKLI